MSATAAAHRRGPPPAHIYPQMQSMIDRACQRTLEQLASEALDEERTLHRLQRFFRRATEHRYYSPCGVGEHDPWTFFSDYELLSGQHDWTLRILRRARRPVATG